MEKMESFETELTLLIDSVDEQSGTADRIFSKYISECLEYFNKSHDEQSNSVDTGYSWLTVNGRRI